MNKQTLLYLSIAALAVDVIGAAIHSSPLLGLGGLASLAAWIIGLVLAARNKNWLWLVGILLFTPLATLLYCLIGPAPKQFASGPYPLR